MPNKITLLPGEFLVSNADEEWMVLRANPCACGSHRVHILPDYISADEDMYYVHCERCQTDGPSCPGEAEAMHAWNSLPSGSVQ